MYVCIYVCISRCVSVLIILIYKADDNLLMVLRPLAEELAYLRLYVPSGDIENPSEPCPWSCSLEQEVTSVPSPKVHYDH
jgi:hypothetical protein